MCQFRGSTWMCEAMPIAPPGTDTIRKSKTFISRSQPTCAVRGLLYIDGLRCAPPILRTTPLILRTNRFRWVLIRVAEHFGDFAARYFAAIDVESVAQVFVLLQRPHDAAIGEFEHERQRRAVERVGRRARHRAGHVGNAVVHDAVDGVYRIGVARWARGFETAALIDRHVDDHRARLHPCEHRARYQLRRARAGHER